MAERVAPNPFPGYRPFNAEDAHQFFGREDEADAVMARLEEVSALAVVGTAENGKSSLVRAGVIPRVRRRGGRVALLRPGEDPVGNLARALAAPEALGRSPLEIERVLRSGPHGLVECVRAAGVLRDQFLLVIVDPLDELVRYRRCRELLGTAPDDEPFVAMLLNDELQKAGVRVLFTARADSVEQYRAYPALYEAVRRESFELHALSAHQLRRAIQAPVEAGGASVSQEFVETVVAAFDPTHVPGRLPLIQHALMRTWDARKEPGEELTLRHYDSIGGVEAALVQHADEVFKTEPAQELFEKVIHALADRVDGSFVLRPAPIGEIARMCNDAPVVDVEGVVARLRAPGLTLLKPSSTGAPGERSVVDVSYDSFTRLRSHRWSHRQIVIDAARDVPARHPHVAGRLWATSGSRRAWLVGSVLAAGTALGIAASISVATALLFFVTFLVLATANDPRFVSRYLWPVLLTLSTLSVPVVIYLVTGPPADVRARGPAGRDGGDGRGSGDERGGGDGRGGTAGPPGRDGAPGQDGAPGRTGDPGPLGPPGPDGQPGRNGLDGRAGLDGRDGQPGTSGVSALSVRCPNGQMLVGVEKGAALCQPAPGFPFNPGPAVQFADLVGVARGFVYRVEERTWLKIPELDLRLWSCTTGCRGGERLVRVTDERSSPPTPLYGGEDGEKPVQDSDRPGQFDVRFSHRGYEFLITLGPGRQAVVRRCAGAPCVK